MSLFILSACQNKSAEFCKEITGFENAICREISFEYEKVRAHVCQFPEPFIRAELKSMLYTLRVGF